MSITTSFKCLRAKSDKSASRPYKKTQAKAIYKNIHLPLLHQ
nr:MAG TPA: hypothetical protein [Caudoviricetes sp.]